MKKHLYFKIFNFFILYFSFCNICFSYYKNADELLQSCSKYLEPTLYDDEYKFIKEVMDTVSCRSFFDGYLEAYQESITHIFETSSFNEISNKNVRKKLFCLPESEWNFKANQSIKVTVKFLEDNPKYLNLSAGESIFLALYDAFPCK